MACGRGYTYGDCLRHVTKVWETTEVNKAIQFQTHLSDCPDCQRVTKTMDGWVEEDRKIAEHIMGLPFPILEEELHMAINQGNAASAHPIVDRLIQEARRGNQRALPLLRMAAKQAPAIPGEMAREYLQIITAK